MHKIPIENFGNFYNSLICRLCAEETLNGINLFQDNNHEICRLVNRYLPIKISDDGKYTKLICPACHLQLESTQQFFDLVNKGQLKLKQLYKSSLQTKVSLTTRNSNNIELQQDGMENVMFEEIPNHSSISTSANENNTKKYELFKNELEQPTDYYTASKRKRGRPTKPPPEILEAKQAAAEAEYEAKQMEKLKEIIKFENEIICGLTKASGGEQRKKRHIKIPLRFQEVVRGRDLERVYVENGVMGKYQTKSASTNIVDHNNSSNIITDETDEQQNDGTNEIIGYLKDENGTNLGDLINISKNKTLITSKKQHTISFICDICHRTFNHENRYVIHRQSHCNVIYECTTCLATFLNRIDLINHHIDTQHTGQGIIESLEEECFDDMGQSSIKETTSSLLSPSIITSTTTNNNELNLLSIFNDIVDDNTDDVNEAAKVLYNLQNLQRPTPHQPPEYDTEMEMINCNNHMIEFECNDNKSLAVDFSDNEKLAPVAKTTSEIPHIKRVKVKKGNIKKKNRLKKRKSTKLAIKAEKKEGDNDDYMNEMEKTTLPKLLKCKFCERTFTNISSLMYHCGAEHNKLRRFVCVTCNKEFKHKQILQRHQLVHTNVRPFPCNQCTSSFKTAVHLKNHMTRHTGVKKFKCNICDQMFTHKTSIKYHLQWHMGSKPFKCLDCGKSFTQNGNLREHMRIHTGERPYECDLCDKKFKTSSQYQIHKMRHTNHRPHVCEICSKTFLDGQTFKTHLRRHRNEKPFLCPHCSRQFSEHWALNKHLRTHTGEKPYKCPFCDRRYADCSNLIRHKKLIINILIHDGVKQKDIDNELKVNNENDNSILPTLVTSSDIIDGILPNDKIDNELVTNTNNYITKNESPTLMSFDNDDNPNTNSGIADKQPEQIIYITYPNESAMENYEQYESNKNIQISDNPSTTLTHAETINNCTSNIEIITSAATAIDNDLAIYPPIFTYMGT